MKQYVFLFSTMLGAMEQQYSYVLAHINQEPITKHIIKYIGDQSEMDNKFENFKALLKSRRVNKTWRKLCDEVYQELLAEEKTVVASNWQQDYDEIRVKKNIYPLKKESSVPYCDKIYLYRDKLIACSINRNLVVWLHNQLHTKQYGIEQIYRFQHNKKSLFVVPEVQCIYPITWAVYMSAKPSQKLLVALYSHNEDFVKQLNTAYNHKKFFDDFVPELLNVKDSDVFYRSRQKCK